MILVTVRSKLSDMDILFQIMHWNEDNTGVVALHRENMETEARLSAQEESLTSKFRETADRTRTNSHIKSRVKTDLVSRYKIRMSQRSFSFLASHNWSQDFRHEPHAIPFTTISKPLIL